MGRSRRIRGGHGVGAVCALSLLAAGLSGQEEEQSVTPPASQESAPRPVVRAVRVEGNRRYTAEQIAAAFGQRVGEPLMEESEVRRGIEVLFGTFHVRVLIELLPSGADQREV